MRRSLLLLLAPAAAAAERVVLDNGLVRREFELDRGVWRTVALARSGGGDAVTVRSDEFHLRFLDDAELTAADYEAAAPPDLRTEDGGRVLRIRYRRRAGAVYPEPAPLSAVIEYTARPGEPYLRKRILFDFPPRAAVDRLEVERFVTATPAAWGGRGQPVFVGGVWFFGLEHPAGHSRHTDGNTPAPDAHRFELVGNYSVVELEGRDRETHPAPGLIRLFHFPGFAREAGGVWRIESQTAVAGVGRRGEPMELAFLDYLDTIRKKPRSFTHYNNWFDPAGKNLQGDRFVAVGRAFQQALAPAGVRLDALAPDNGWQDRRSIWQPAPAQFPGGMADLAALGRSLREAGSSLGLWLALDGTTCDIGWGEGQGYARATPSRYFSRFFAHYCLAQPALRADLERQLRTLVREGRLSYFKHDFNHLSCVAAGHGHPATERHGHEANVDAMLALLAACREESPDLYQNLTNWIWFSPWWLMHGDALWMLAGDDGFNGNTPELSTRAMATTDRDTYLWRMWGDPADRPLVPISHLMTHGIVRNPGGQMESPQDTIADWADHVMMYYGRGVQMKEWYLTPAAMSPDHWRALLGVHRWSSSNFAALANTVFVGGRPDEGRAYGYVGWAGERGVLVARNPSVAGQALRVPLDATTWFRGAAGRAYRARVVYPYHDGWPAACRSGQTMEFILPGYATMAFELEPGEPLSAAAAAEPARPDIRREGATLMAAWTPPKAKPARTDLLVIGHPDLPVVRAGGAMLTPARTSRSVLNPFAGYARAGMPSTNAQPWRMAAYDLNALPGPALELTFAAEPEAEACTFEAWLLLEQAVPARAAAADPWSPAEGVRRRTVPLAPRMTLESAPVARRALTPAEWAGARSVRLRLEVFGVNGGEFGAKEAWLNGQRLGVLPAGGDEWKAAALDVPAGLAGNTNVLEVRHNGREDKFKFRGAELRVELAGGARAASARQPAAQTSFADWAFAEGAPFATPTSSVPVRLDFGP